MILTELCMLYGNMHTHVCEMFYHFQTFSESENTETLGTYSFGKTYLIEMATIALETSVNTLPDTPILPNYVDHPIVLAKIVDFAIFQDCDPREVVFTLQTYFSGLDSIVIALSDTPPTCSSAAYDC